MDPFGRCLPSSVVLCPSSAGAELHRPPRRSRGNRVLPGAGQIGECRRMTLKSAGDAPNGSYRQRSLCPCYRQRSLCPSLICSRKRRGEEPQPRGKFPRDDRAAFRFGIAPPRAPGYPQGPLDARNALPRPPASRPDEESALEIDLATPLVEWTSRPLGVIRGLFNSTALPPNESGNLGVTLLHAGSALIATGDLCRRHIGGRLAIAIIAHKTRSALHRGVLRAPGRDLGFSAVCSRGE